VGDKRNKGVQQKKKGMSNQKKKKHQKQRGAM